MEHSDEPPLTVQGTDVLSRRGMISEADGVSGHRSLQGRLAGVQELAGHPLFTDLLTTKEDDTMKMPATHDMAKEEFTRLFKLSAETHRSLATKLEVSPSSIQRWLNGGKIDHSGMLRLAMFKVIDDNALARERLQDPDAQRRAAYDALTWKAPGG